ncbi:MAG: HEPN domain-containing protein [bacterium]
MSEYAKEIAANLERAENSIKAAKKLEKANYPDIVASRAYYAAFYAATALLLKEGLQFRTHSGLISTIHKKFIKPGKLDKKYGRNLNRLFELRNVGDYGAATHVTTEDAEKSVIVAEKFIVAIKSLLEGDAE